MAAAAVSAAGAGENSVVSAGPSANAQQATDDQPAQMPSDGFDGQQPPEMPSGSFDGQQFSQMSDQSLGGMPGQEQGFGAQGGPGTENRQPGGDPPSMP